MWENLNSTWARQYNVIEQGITNYLIHHDKLFNDCLIKSENTEGHVMTVGMLKKDNIKFDSKNNLLNGKGEIAAVVHQYDRHKEIVKRVRDKFCNALNVLVLGFDKYKIDEISKKISFSIYFFIIDNMIFDKKLSFFVNIKYNNNLLGGLNEDKEEKVKVECDKVGYKDNKVEFHCKVNFKEKTIKNIEIINNNFEFISQEVIINGFTSMALKKKYNLLNVEKEEIFNKKIYVLENAKIIEKDNEGFNITGTIDNNNLFINCNKSIKIVVFDKEKEKEKKIKCYIYKAEIFKFICKTKENIIFNLYEAMAYLKNEFLIFKCNGHQNNIDFNKNLYKYYLEAIEIINKIKKMNKFFFYGIIFILILFLFFLMSNILKVNRLLRKIKIIISNTKIKTQLSKTQKKEIQLQKGIKKMKIKSIFIKEESDQLN